MLALEFRSVEARDRAMRLILKLNPACATKEAMVFTVHETRFFVVAADSIFEGVPAEAGLPPAVRLKREKDGLLLGEERLNLPPEVQFCEFWQSIEPVAWQAKRMGEYWFLIHSHALGQAIRRCLQAFHFQISRVDLSEDHVLLRVIDATMHLAEQLIEDCDAEVFWLEAHTSILHPLGHWHPLAASLKTPQDHFVLLSSKGLSILDKSAFRPALNGVQWNFEPVHSRLEPAEEAFGFELKLSLVADESDAGPTVLHQYAPSQFEALEDWIQTLPVAEQNCFTVQKIGDGSCFVRAMQKSANPLPPADRRFYALGGLDSGVYIKEGLRLSPHLPLSEIKRIFEVKPGRLILLDASGDQRVQCESLQSLGFVRLETLVFSSFVDRRGEYHADPLRVVLQDPALDIYDLEELQSGIESDLFSSQSDSPTSGGSVTLEQEAVNPVDTIESDTTRDPRAYADRDTSELKWELIRIQDVIRSGPESANTADWAHLAMVAHALGDFRLALQSAELCWIQGGAPGFDIQMVAPWWFEWVEEEPQDALQRVLFADSAAFIRDIMTPGFVFLHDMDIGENISTDLRRAWYEAIDQIGDRIVPIRWVLFLFAGAQRLGVEEWYVHRVRDKALARVFEAGAVSSGCLPDFLNRDSQAENELGEQLAAMAADLEASGKLQAEELGFFNLIRGVAASRDGDNSSAQHALSVGERQLYREYPNDALYEVMGGLYRMRARQHQESELDDSELLLSMKSLSPSLAYKAELLRSRSLLLQSVQQVAEPSNSLKEEFYHLKKRSAETLAEELPRLMRDVMRTEGSEQRVSFRKASLWSMALRVLPRLGREESGDFLEDIDRGWRQLTSKAQRGHVLGRLVATARLLDREDILESSRHGLKQLVRELTARDAAVLETMLLPLMEDFVNLFEPQEMVEWIQLMERPLSGEDPATLRSLSMIATLYGLTGNEKSASRALQRSLELYVQSSMQPQEAIRSLSLIFRCALLAGGSNRLEVATFWHGRYAELQDRLSLSSHICLSRLLYLEFLFSTAMETERNSAFVTPEVRTLQLWLETRIKEGLGRVCTSLLQQGRQL